MRSGRAAYPKRIDRRLQMGSDYGWNTAVAVEPGKRFGH